MGRNVLTSRVLAPLLLSVTLSGVVKADRIDDASITDLQKFAAAGDHEATHALCYRYLYGAGGAKQDFAVALHWCESAAKTGDPSSVTLLAEMSYRGEATPVDYNRAFELYMRAAKREFPHAEFMIALMYGRGQGVAQNDSEGIVWLKRAADAGYDPAKQLLEDIRKENPSLVK